MSNSSSKYQINHLVSKALYNSLMKAELSPTVRLFAKSISPLLVEGNIETPLYDSGEETIPPSEQKKIEYVVKPLFLEYVREASVFEQKSGEKAFSYCVFAYSSQEESLDEIGEDEATYEEDIADIIAAKVFLVTIVGIDGSKLQEAINALIEHDKEQYSLYARSRSCYACRYKRSHTVLQLRRILWQYLLPDIQKRVKPVVHTGGVSAEIE